MEKRNFHRSMSMREKPTRGGGHSDGGSPSTTTTTDELSYHDYLQDCQTWIKRAMTDLLESGQLRRARAGDAQSCLARLSGEIHERTNVVSRVSWLGRKLISVNSGNVQLCEEIEKEVCCLKESYTCLKDTMEQMQAQQKTPVVTGSQLVGTTAAAPSTPIRVAPLEDAEEFLGAAAVQSRPPKVPLRPGSGEEDGSRENNLRRCSSLRVRGHHGAGSDGHYQTRRHHQRPQHSSPLAEDASEACRTRLEDCERLIEQTLQKLLDEAYAFSQTQHQPQQSSLPTPQPDSAVPTSQANLQKQRLTDLCTEVDKLQTAVNEVSWLGGQLIEASGDNSRRVKGQLGKLKSNYGVLKDIARQIREKQKRRFDCGHTEELDWQTSFRRVNNQFCSSCWSLASQIHKEKLNRGRDQRNSIKRTLLAEENDDTAQEYFKVHDRVMRYVKPEHGIDVRIQSIEKIENPVLDGRLYDAYNQLHKKDCVPELLIHGTKGNIAETIIKEGFKVGTQGMYGAGIYFATDTTKSAQYCKEGGVKSLLLCDVLLGKPMVCKAPRNDLNLATVTNAGYDSVFAKRNTKRTGGVANDEYIVYRPEQAAPKYLVKFT